jgi:hypothetical protein
LATPRLGEWRPGVLGYRGARPFPGGGFRWSENVELPGSAYLFTLATLSVTFAGFCAIVIVLRQTAGKELSGWHLILTRLYIEAGFWAAGFCMLPPLLALCGLSQPVVWRTSSAAIALVMIVYGATYPKRRRLIATEPAPPRRWLLIVIVVGSTLVIAGLLGNAIGVSYEPGIAPVAVAASWTLACGATIFIATLVSFWERPNSH